MKSDCTGDASLPILTVHQSKGLEFDTVIIAHLCVSSSAPSAIAFGYANFGCAMIFKVR